MVPVASGRLSLLLRRRLLGGPSPSLSLYTLLLFISIIQISIFFSNQLYFSPYFSNFPCIFNSLIVHTPAVVAVSHVLQQSCFAPCQPSHRRRSLGVEQRSADRCAHRHLFPAPRCSDDCSAWRLIQRQHVSLLLAEPDSDAAAGPYVPDAGVAG